MTTASTAPSAALRGCRPESIAGGSSRTAEALPFRDEKRENRGARPILLIRQSENFRFPAHSVSVRFLRSLRESLPEAAPSPFRRFAAVSGFGRNSGLRPGKCGKYEQPQHGCRHQDQKRTLHAASRRCGPWRPVRSHIRRKRKPPPEAWPGTCLIYLISFPSHHLSARIASLLFSVLLIS